MSDSQGSENPLTRGPQGHKVPSSNQGSGTPESIAAQSVELQALSGAVRAHYTKVCHCEWSDDEFTRTMTNEHCSIHGSIPDPLDELVAAHERLRTFIEEIKRLASDPFASDTVALRACLLAANEALGFPGPEPSPEREIARSIIKEFEQDG